MLAVCSMISLFYLVWSYYVQRVMYVTCIYLVCLQPSSHNGNPYSLTRNTSMYKCKNTYVTNYTLTSRHVRKYVYI